MLNVLRLIFGITKVTVDSFIEYNMFMITENCELFKNIFTEHKLVHLSTNNYSILKIACIFYEINYDIDIINE